MLPTLRLIGSSSRVAQRQTKIYGNSRLFIRTFAQMASFNVESNGVKVPVTVPEHVQAKEDELRQFRPFKEWIHNLTKSVASHDGAQFKSIEIQSVDYFGTGKVGFVKLKADVVHPSGKKLPGIVLLRGGSVAMLVQLVDKDSYDRYIILTSQPRVASGHLELLELPAGMIDDGTFSGAAAKELEEECGIVIEEDKLQPLSETPVYVSPGITDETMSFYTFTQLLSSEEIKNIEGKLTGDESEAITLKIVKAEHIHHYQQDSKLLMALALFNMRIPTINIPE